ncbi:hypothetical protein MUN76_07900 [Leucobacter rhizosphaerae]|uniref:DUF2971 domain-containing protein n=1 Tax=Leucobacter rhizosphaerae TaxID=2932245 RepID=A0ABY4FS39_9MICO|nr:hypothetical protein [Leucobacter rhizosphaerae]UOQ58994.1 hypothetical protein MUN76_07900 [Leucobacter rhizosphaerae]
MDESLPVKPDEVWHYTTAAGLRGIVENDYLFACPATQMNDAKELLEGREVVEKALAEEAMSENPGFLANALALLGTFAETVDESEGLYLVSASTNGDNLSLWRNYGESASYAIRFDPDKRLRPIVDLGSLDRELGPDELPGIKLDAPYPHAAATISNDWVAVDYEQETAEQLARQIAHAARRAGGPDDLHRSFITDYRSRILGRTKHSSFSAESEVRKIIRVSPEQAFLGFRDSPRGLARHVRVGYSTLEPLGDSLTVGGKRIHACIETVEKLPILEVKLSPTGHRSSALRTLENFLAVNGYRDVELSRSASPFIG